MKSNFSIFMLLLISLQSLGQSKAEFSKSEVLSDLKFLRESLTDAHYDLFAYTSESEFDAVYQEVKGLIDEDSFNLLETTSIFQRLISAINIGHTGIDFPVQSYLKYGEAGGTLFPLEIAFEYGKPLVRKNFSNNNSITIGSEILSINGASLAAILSKIYPLISAERTYLKNAKIELFSFPRYYWQAFGKEDNFEVKIRSNGKVEKYSLDAVDLIEGYEMKRDDILNAQMKLKFFGPSAYLNPGNFSGDEQKYRQFIDSAFAAINEKDSENLIIDLRNNGGGNDTFSDYLVSYFADQPFKWNSTFTLKTSRFLKDHIRTNKDTTDLYWQAALNHKNGEIYSYEFDEYQPQPKPKRFSGKVLVLVNRQSHSQAAVTAAQVQDYNFGTIVGEETGDYPSLYASIYQYSLPNTGINVNVSKGHIVRVNGSTKEEGVIPDIFIKDHLLDDEDEILEGILTRIDQQQ